ncbi:MAG TPA: LuxR C-terminal-related transcriptional regulator [Anaerolineales bacterium]|jgi:DNA-binding CsgD family transcriptional regulator
MRENFLFSEREDAVITQLLMGRSNKQIALELGVSIRTVEFHLSHIYSKLGVNSRTEAALVLADKNLGKSAGDLHSAGLRESVVEKTVDASENGVNPHSTRSLPMKNLFITATGLLATLLVALLALANLPVKNSADLPAFPTGTSTPLIPTSTATFSPSPEASSKKYILNQIRQSVAEYEQNVQAEKKSGQVQFSRDTQTGAEIFLFQDGSYVRILDLHDQLMQKINQLDSLYIQLYRDELQPTPFPTQATAELNKAFYTSTMQDQAESLCSLKAWQQDGEAETVLVYDPDEGNYRTIYFGDILAKCEVFGRMLEEFRVTPIMAKVNRDADMETIRRVTGKVELQLTFQSIQSLANAPWQNAALYVDETGNKYYVEVESGRLAMLEPNFPTHPVIQSHQKKSIDELRGIAGQFALTNSPRLAELKSVLQYTENSKTTISFFTWTYRSRDWSGTDWVMMPPFIQVGVMQNGQVVTYINTLDLYK